MAPVHFKCKYHDHNVTRGGGWLARCGSRRRSEWFILLFRIIYNQKQLKTSAHETEICKKINLKK